MALLAEAVDRSLRAFRLTRMRPRDTAGGCREAAAAAFIKPSLASIVQVPKSARNGELVAAAPTPEDVPGSRTDPVVTQKPVTGGKLEPSSS